MRSNQHDLFLTPFSSLQGVAHPSSSNSSFVFMNTEKKVAGKEIKMRKESRQESSEYFFLC